MSINIKNANDRPITLPIKYLYSVREVHEHLVAHGYQAPLALHAAQQDPIHYTIHYIRINKSINSSS